MPAEILNINLDQMNVAPIISQDPDNVNYYGYSILALIPWTEV